MRVLIAGANGTIGSELCRQLKDAGHEIVGISRSQSGAGRLREAGFEAVIADVMDRDSLLSALDDVAADAVAHEATAITTTPTAHRHLYATDALRDRGTRHLLEAARAVGAGRFVTQSFLFGYGYHDHGPALITEDAPFGAPGVGKFNRHLSSMRSNEEQVLGASDLAGMSLRYGVFYGNEASTLKLMSMVGRRRMVAPRHAGVASFVHIEDAAAATVAALEHGRAGQAYNIADDHPISWSDYLDSVAVATDAPPVWHVPSGLLRVTPYLHGMMVKCRLRLDNGKAKRELGWSPRYPSTADGLAAIVRHRGSEVG